MNATSRLELVSVYCQVVVSGKSNSRPVASVDPTPARRRRAHSSAALVLLERSASRGFCTVSFHRNPLIGPSLSKGPVGLFGKLAGAASHTRCLRERTRTCGAETGRAL